MSYIIRAFGLLVKCNQPKWPGVAGQDRFPVLLTDGILAILPHSPETG
jgi:hypothetical protein